MNLDIMNIEITLKDVLIEKEDKKIFIEKLEKEIIRKLSDRLTSLMIDDMRNAIRKDIDSMALAKLESFGESGRWKGPDGTMNTIDEFVAVEFSKIITGNGVAMNLIHKQAINLSNVLKERYDILFMGALLQNLKGKDILKDERILEIFSPKEGVPE